MKNIEVLSPCGSIESFYAACAAGCNAVYLSGKHFGARAYADNFTIDELKEVISFAHLRSIKVYVTINTIIYDNEYNELDNYLQELTNLKIDAVIVQDIGVLFYIKEHFPKMVVHASTQMNVNNIDVIKTMYNLGVDRVILAREYNLDQLKIDLDNNPYLKELEYEVFCHGALCFSQSGKCLFSFAHGGRSGNRGQCAGGCRQHYQLYEDDILIENYCNLISMKDLYTLDHIKELYDLDIIDSIKIEGRMKSPSYVYQTACLYKHAVESAYKGKSYIPTKEELDNLNIIFNRTYTKGYLFKDNNTNLTTKSFVNHQGIIVGKVEKISKNGFYFKTKNKLHIHDNLRVGNEGIFITYMEINNNKVIEANPSDFLFIESNKKFKINDSIKLTSSEHLDKEIQNSINKYVYKKDVSCILKAYVGKKLELSLKLDKSSFNVSVIGETLIESFNQLDNDRIKEQLSKMGDSIYKLNNCLILTDNNSFIKISMLNDLRRQAIDKLNELLLSSYNVESKRSLNIKPFIATKRTSINYTAIVDNIEQYNICQNLGFNEIIYSSDFTRINNKTLIKNDLSYPNNGILSFYNNIISTNSILAASSLGYDEIILSPEANPTLIDYTKLTNINLGLLVYGRYDLMISNHCPIASFKNYLNKNCNSCLNHSYKLIDEKNNSYPLHFERDGCLFKILSDYPINNSKYMNNDYFNSYYFIFTKESINEIKEIYKKMIEK